MIFSRIIFSVVLIGLMIGSLMTVIQIFTINPIIFTAESYEIVEHQNCMHDQDGNDGGGRAWTPEDGAERTAYTLLANSSAGIGLPPEIPGFETAPIQSRQLWWVFTVTSVSIGLGILAFAVIRVKAIGLIFLAMPYVIGVPGVDGAEFTHLDAAAASALIQLQQQFFVTSGIANLVFWLISGIICTRVFNRWFRQIGLSTKHASS